MSNAEDFVIKNGVLVEYKGKGGDVVIPEGVTEIKDGGLWQGVFNNVQDKLKSISFPEGLTNIGNNAFYDCEKLREIVLPQSLKRIGSRAFSGCSKIKQIDLPEGLTYIGESAFSCCFDLKSISIPSSVSSLENSAFSSCKSLKSLVLPEGLRELGSEVFESCDNLTQIVLPRSLKSIGSGAFLFCKLLKEIKYNGTLDDWKAVEVDPSCFGISFLVKGEYRYIKDNVKWSLTPEGKMTVEQADDESKLLPSSLSPLSSHLLTDFTKEIYVSEDIKSIGDWYFDDLYSVNKIILPAKLFSPKIISFDKPTSVTFILYENGKTVRRIGGAYKKYWRLFPIDDKDIPSYDQLIMTGSYDGFKMNVNCRIIAAFDRLLNSNKQIDEETRKSFSVFLSSKLNKAIEIASEEEAPEYIRTLIELGVINDENKAAVKKKLSASACPEIKNMDLDGESLLSSSPLPVVEKYVPDSRLPFAARLKTLKADDQLKKIGVITLPEVVFADGSGPASGDYLRYIIVEYLVQSRKREVDMIKEVDETAAKLDLNSLRAALRNIYDSIPKTEHKYDILQSLFRYSDDETVKEIYPVARDFYGKRKVVDRALLLNDSRTAMIYANKNDLINWYANLRHTTAQAIKDNLMSDFGLDKNGEKIYDLGSGTVKVSLSSDLKLLLYDVKNGKPVKSIPKRNADPDKYDSATADYADLKKNIKTVAKDKANQLFKAFLDASSFDVEEWKSIYLDNPVFNRVARLVVWQQGKSTFTVTESGIVNEREEQYELKAAKIKVAHPMEMKSEVTVAWQKYFVSKGLKQPFNQVWEPVLSPEDIKKGRYAKCRIPYYRFIKQEKHGIYVEDYDFHNDIEISFKGCSADVERLDYERHYIDMNHCFEIKSISFKEYTRQVNHIIAYFDRITALDRVRKDDLSVMDQISVFTLSQVSDFIAAAQEANAAKVLAALMDYKNANFGDYDPMDEFTIAW